MLKNASHLCHAHSQASQPCQYFAGSTPYSHSTVVHSSPECRQLCRDVSGVLECSIITVQHSYDVT